MGVDVKALESGDSDYIKSLLVIKDLTDEKSRDLTPRFLYNLTPTGRKFRQAVEFTQEFAYKVSFTKVITAGRMCCMMTNRFS